MASSHVCKVQENSGPLHRRPASLHPPKVNGQDGAFAIMFIPLFITIIAFCGLAVDAGQLYNRKVDLNGIAKAAALAAAHELNGTSSGITAAKAKAKEAAEALRYQYFGAGTSVAWKDEALSFGKSSSRSGTWTPSASISASSTTDVSSLYFAKVDAAGLDPEITTVSTSLIGIFFPSLATIQMNDSVVAGRASVNVTPLGICAMSADRTGQRSYTGSSGTLTELLQYGFRRGVSYDLMQLNPTGSTPARYAINPVIAPGASGPDFSISPLGPFACNGTMWVPRLSGGPVRVSELPSAFPLASLYVPLNSRFDIYSGGPCNSVGAPPDANIKSFAYDAPNTLAYMIPNSGSAAAAKAESANRLETVADTLTPAKSGDYGPLWLYTKAAKAPSPLTDAEPTATFSASDWPTLYPSGPTASAYPSAVPYQATSASTGYYEASATHKSISLRNQRVLNLPLLSCTPSAPSGANAPATVVAIGKFFMTVPAKPDKLIAEFAGLLPDASLSGQVELYP